MPRKSTFWWNEEKQCYFTTINKKKIRLSPDEKEAETAFHTLMSQREDPAQTGVFPTFRKIADLFLAESERSKAPNTYRMIKFYLQGFCDHIGRKRVNDLKVHHVSAWLVAPKKRHPWNDGGKSSARATVLACLNWAVAEGHMNSHPLGKLKRGTHGKRERVLSGEERQKIRDNVKSDFRDFLFALEQTGARPFSELALVTAEMIDWAGGTITFRKHKNVNKGKTRTIYMSPALRELLTRLAAERPTGYLFRNIKGHVWKSHDATRRLHYVTDKLGIPKATVYAFRHSFITDALSKGLSADVIAELDGNSAITIARAYSHLHEKKAAMIEAAARAVG